jgi:SOS response regulatory protein OraA/RecX
VKKAREIEIPETRNLTWEEYSDFNSHAIASSMWYASNYSRNSNQIREKLYAKGYPRDEVPVDTNSGETIHKNMVEDTVEYLVESLLIDDRQYALSVINSQLSRGFGMSKVRMALSMKKVDRELAQDLLDSLDLEAQNFDAIDKAAKRVLKSSAYLKLPEGRPRQQKLTQQLASKGFSFGDISEWRANNEELLGEEY